MDTCRTALARRDGNGNGYGCMGQRRRETNVNATGCHKPEPPTPASLTADMPPGQSRLSCQGVQSQFKA